jgi:hypothetical protein
MTPDTTTQATNALAILRPCFSGQVPLRFGGVWATLEKAAGRYTLRLTDVDAPIDAARLGEYAAAFGVVTVEHMQTGHTAMVTWEADGD